jgi:hypothetical protein
MIRLKGVGALIAAAGFSIWLVSVVSAGTIELSWDRVQDANGYRIYYGTSPGTYTNSVTVGNSTSASLSGLADCTTWYVAVKSYNWAGESAEFSNEISGWPRPEVRSITPSVAEQGSQYVISIAGANFRTGAQLTLNGGARFIDLQGNPLVSIDSAGVLSCGEIQALVNVEPAARGSRAAEVGISPFVVEIINPDFVWGSRIIDLEIQFDENRWDINQEDPGTEGRVDGSDLTWLAYSYGSYEGDALYNADADLNGDGIVDGIDLAYLASGFGLCWSGSAWVADDCG